jgi:hypothetical protein
MELSEVFETGLVHAEDIDFSLCLQLRRLSGKACSHWRGLGISTISNWCLRNPGSLLEKLTKVL